MSYSCCCLWLQSCGRIVANVELVLRGNYIVYILSCYFFFSCSRRVFHGCCLDYSLVVTAVVGIIVLGLSYLVVGLLLASPDAVVVATGHVMVIVPKLCGFVVVLLLCGNMQRCLVLVCCTQTCTYICCWLLFIP